MQEFLNPDKHDLIRETFLVIFGLVIRWIEIRKMKKAEKNDQF